jgi:hypothetical protein
VRRALPKVGALWRKQAISRANDRATERVATGTSFLRACMRVRVKVRDLAP